MPKTAAPNPGPLPAPRRPLIPITGTYLVWGPDREPELHLIDQPTREFLLHRTTSRNPHVRAAAAASVFGKGITEIVLAWDGEVLRGLGEHYEGPQQDRVRRICAALVLGITFEELDRHRGRGGDGGARDRLQPAPVLPQPGGIAVAIPT